MVIRNYNGFPHISPTRFLVYFALVSMLQMVFFASWNGASAQDVDQPSGAVLLEGPILPEQMVGKIDYVLDPSTELTLAEILSRQVAFQPVSTKFPDFGYTKSSIWLRVQVQNQRTDVTQWRIHFRENFKQEFDVYVQRADGLIEHIFSESKTDGFNNRPIPYPEMVAPLRLAAHEAATLYIRYWSEGSSQLAFGFETDISFAARAAGRTAKNFLYYGMMLLLILISLIALYLFRHGVFAAYTLNCIALLLYLMHADGVTFQYLWPNSPAFNSFASIPLGAAIIIFAPNFTRVFLNTKKYHPILNVLLLAVIFGTLAMALSSVVIDKQMLKKTFVLLALISISLCTISGIVAAMTRFKEVRFFLLAWGGFLAASIIMSMRHWLGIEISQDLQFDIMRVVMVADATLMGLSIADRLNQLRVSRLNAVQANFEHENRNLRLLSRLSDLEKRHAVAIADSAGENQKTADALHDLRQPLHALRLNIRDMTVRGEASEPKLKDAEDAFSYIEQLMADTMRRLGPAPTPVAMPSPDSTLSLGEITDSVFEMFLADATEKGLDLRYYPPRTKLAVPPLPAMRIIANLVSNAIKYTDVGKILLCTRQRGAALRVEVHDTGPGMTAAQFSQATTRHKQLSTSAGGYGLGLSIVQEIAEENGFIVEKLCDRSGGFSIGVSFPMQAK
jgi:signal transduction histidine kinase